MNQPNATLASFVVMCGLSHQETSEYLSGLGHAASLGSVRAWIRDLYRPPDGVLTELHHLYETISRTDETIDRIGRPLPEGALTRRRDMRQVTSFADLRREMERIARADPDFDEETEL